MDEQKIKDLALPVMWHEGMPLTPQVFQHDFLYQRTYIAKLFQNLNQTYYGIIDIEWNDLYISDGILQLKSLECILPDLTYCKLPIDETDKLSINLKELNEAQPNKQSELKDGKFVFLILPNNHFAYTNSFARARYCNKEIEGVKDLTNKETEARISLLKPDFQIIVDNIVPIGYVGLPLGKVKFTGINFVFTDYVGPILAISQNKILIQTVKNLIKSGRDKLAYLTAKSDNSTEYKIFITNLAKIVFILEKNIQCNPSPNMLYADLVNILNNALLFNTNTGIPLIPEYNNLDHSASISPLLDFIQNSIDKIQESYKKEKFQEEDGLFAIKAKYSDYVTIGLIKGIEKDASKLLDWINNAIIASDDKLTIMQDQRIVGAIREYIRRDEALDLNSTQDLVLIKIKFDSKYITQDKMLCIMNFETENRPKEIVLFHENW